MARTRRGSFQVRSPRRRKAWEVGPGQQAVQTPISSISAVLVTSGVVLQQDGLTALRIRGALSVWLTSASALSEGYTGAFGMGIVTEEAFTDVGVSATPTPITEQDWDGWMYWTAFNVTAQAGSVTASQGTDGLSVQRFDIDSKAMRKVREGDVIYGVIQVLEVGTAVLGWHMDSRMLFALP